MTTEPSRIDDYKKQIKRLQEIHLDRIRVLAESVQAEIITPFCLKHAVRFEAAMGEYSFFANGKNLTHEWEVWGEKGNCVGPNAPEGYQEVFDALHLEWSEDGDRLCEFMSSFRTPE